MTKSHEEKLKAVKVTEDNKNVEIKVILRCSMFVLLARCTNTMKLKLSINDQNYPDDSAAYILSKCDDFKEDVGVMENMVYLYGCIVLLSPKGHLEIAGAEIKFDWVI